MTSQPKDSDLDLVNLSRYTQLHIEIIQHPSPNSVQDCTTVFNQAVPEQSLAPLKLSERPTSEENEIEDDVDPILSEFTLFPRLPVEIQDQIWKHLIESTPRLVRFATRSNPLPIFLQISKKLLNDYQNYGYVGLKHRERFTGRQFTTIFHPDVDLLYFSTQVFLCKYETVIASVLTESGAATKLRNIAFHIGIPHKVHSHFPKLPKLEGTFFVYKTILHFRQDPPFGQFFDPSTSPRHGQQGYEWVFPWGDFKEVSMKYQRNSLLKNPA